MNQIAFLDGLQLSKEDVKALNLAIESLRKQRQTYYAYSAAQFDPNDKKPLPFAVLAKGHWDELSTAIVRIEMLLEKYAPPKVKK